MLEGKATPKEWYNAVNAFWDIYNSSMPVQLQSRHTQGQRHVTWENYLKSQRHLQASPDYLDLFAFVHAYTGNGIANWHPTLSIQAIFSHFYESQLSRIQEASRRGAEAAKTHNQTPPLENLAATNE